MSEKKHTSSFSVGIIVFLVIVNILLTLLIGYGIFFWNNDSNESTDNGNSIEEIETTNEITFNQQLRFMQSFEITMMKISS